MEVPAWVEEIVPRYLVEIRLLDLALWQWIGALLLLVAASFIGLFVALGALGAGRCAASR